MKGRRTTRRRWFGEGAAAIGLTALSTRLDAKPATDAASWTFRLEETAGLRRFGYPVHAVLPEVPDGERFRLERDGKPVPAQFRRVADHDGRPAVTLDFNASPGPLQSQVYTVKPGDPVEPKGGLKVVREGGNFVVSSGSSLRYTIPETLTNLVRSVRNASLEFIGDVSRDLSLVLRTTDSKTKALSFGATGPVEASITRQGPFAIGLRFQESIRTPSGRTIRVVADLTFPSSKSWVETAWTVDDPEGLVTHLSFQVPLKVEGSPTLVDLGASNTVYGTIQGKEVMVLLAGREPVRPEPNPGASWIVFKGTLSEATGGIPQFACSTRPDGPLPEGWAHVMDRQRCTAVAVEGFGRSTRDQLAVDGAGKVEFFRGYAGSGATEGPKGVKTIRYWVHFVTNPVQIGALTSPQAMLAPLAVQWQPAGR